MGEHDTVRVQVRLFAGLRDQLGVGAAQVTLPRSAGVAALVDAVLLELPESADPVLARQQLTGSNVRIAVNQRLVEGELCLQDSDEVAFLPPVTGG